MSSPAPCFYLLITFYDQHEPNHALILQSSACQFRKFSNVDDLITAINKRGTFHDDMEKTSECLESYSGKNTLYYFKKYNIEYIIMCVWYISKECCFFCIVQLSFNTIKKVLGDSHTRNLEYHAIPTSGKGNYTCSIGIITSDHRPRVIIPILHK